MSRKKTGRPARLTPQMRAAVEREVLQVVRERYRSRIDRCINLLDRATDEALDAVVAHGTPSMKPASLSALQARATIRMVQDVLGDLLKERSAGS